jgi:hypothetical protein
MNIYFSILEVVLLSISAVIVLPIFVVVFFVGLAGLAGAFAQRTLLKSGSPRQMSGLAVESQVSPQTIGLAASVRFAYGGRPTGPEAAAGSEVG